VVKTAVERLHNDKLGISIEDGRSPRGSTRLGSTGAIFVGATRHQQLKSPFQVRLNPN
jgi:hypothetical protein